MEGETGITFMLFVAFCFGLLGGAVITMISIYLNRCEFFLWLAEVLENQGILERLKTEDDDALR